MNWYLAALKKYATFSGRARRKEFWMFALFHSLAVLVAGILDAVLGWGLWLTIVYALFSFVPTLAVSVRRLHDTDRTGWWLLIGFVPLAGIVLFVFDVIEGTSGGNQYGPDPKGA
ncbi:MULTISPECIES: DUF805 domain-containing protein [unclassified Streptomyces]|uniref:DUF805 domain-containing protein n=1 Tax=unclassified Streptomyces TaxID=2593676 RepID=UPI0036E13228